MKMLNYKPTQLARSSRGFTLIELMVALALGLVMIGAVVTVFVSNQQSARTKQELDRAQEAFRFASHTIMRVVQQGEITDPRLEIELPEIPNPLLAVKISPPPPIPPSSPRDCLGNRVEREISLNGNLVSIDHVRNIFYFNANHPNRLHCRVETHLLPNDPSPTRVDAVIAEGIDHARTEFRFGIPDPANPPTGNWSDNALWVLPPGNPPINWTNVHSVKILLAMQAEGQANGLAAIFSATMRCSDLGHC